jgi:V/A-type H+-transporting ATPase subunit C
MKEYISGEEFSKLSPYMSWGIRECLHRFELNEDPQIIDVVMDHALYGEINGILEKIQFPYLSNMISTMIDLTNIRILIRVKAQNRNRDFLESILIKGGSLKPELFISSLNESLDNFPDKIRHTGYSEAIRDGISILLNTGSLTQLEKVVDDIIMKRVKDGKFISLGIEPVIGYLLAKETEIKNIRIVMVGKINHVSPQVIMERLRDTYV